MFKTNICRHIIQAILFLIIIGSSIASYAQSYATIFVSTASDGPAVQGTSSCPSDLVNIYVRSLNPNGSDNTYVYYRMYWTDENGFHELTTNTWNRSPVILHPTQTTTYTFGPASGPQYSNSIIASNTITFAITVRPRLVQPIIVGTDRFGAGNLTLRITNPVAGLTYAWYDDNVNTNNLAANSDGITFERSALSASREYFVLANGGCIPGIRYRVPVTVYRVQIVLQSQQPPTGPVPLVPGLGATLYAAVPTGDPTPAEYIWYKDGQQVQRSNSSSYHTQASGNYKVAITYNNAITESKSVNVVSQLAEQQINGQQVNFVSQLDVLKPNVQQFSDLESLSTGERQESVTYVDGFGRKIQQVAVQASPSQTDFIQPFVYDAFGEISTAYLPYAGEVTENDGRYKPDFVASQRSFYQNADKVAHDTRAFATTTIEASPLERVLEANKPGYAWQNNSVKATHELYVPDGGNNDVHAWQNLDGTAVYAANQLFKEVQVDEDGRRTEEYRDLSGQIILRRKVSSSNGSTEQLDTYMVYDEAGRVRYVVPPAAVEALRSANNWALLVSQTNLVDQWLYRYSYDEKGRVKERKVPGAAPVYMVYDRFDRVILVQDGNRRAAGTWFFMKYDVQNRVAAQGVLNDGRPYRDLQAEADEDAGEYEERTDRSYTLTHTYPAVEDGSNGNLLAMSFYDTYDFDGDGVDEYRYSSQNLGIGIEPEAIQQVRGLPTLSYKRVVKPNGQYGTWLITALFYDQYGNVVQKQSNNQLTAAGEGSGVGVGVGGELSPEGGIEPLNDVLTNVYREQGFVPQVLRTFLRQTTSFGTISVRNRYVYDHAGRVREAWQQNLFNGNWDAEVLVSNSSYNALGQLVEKNLHSRDGGKTFLQSEDFRYNILGQLTHINNSALTNDGVTNDDSNDIFGLELVREQADNGLGNTARMDGGLSAVRWQARNTAQHNQPERERSYKFTYDGFGRLTLAQYAAKDPVAATWTLEQNAYNERVIRYDANGNITALQRYTQATAAATPQLIDYLFLDYVNGGNQLSAVRDLGSATLGFRNGVTNTTEYAYDANGNLTLDQNKGAGFTYNVLNKVEKQAAGISGGTIEYDYDAAGTLLTRRVTGRVPKTVSYIDGIVYEQSLSLNGLAWVPTPEGRALLDPEHPEHLTYEYQLKDHQGNMRVAFRATAGKGDAQLSLETDEEEGDYPHFHNIASNRVDYGSLPISTQPAVSSGSPGFKLAAVTSARPGPYTIVPVANGDRVKIKVYYSTPNGPQYSRPPASPSPASSTLPNWALVPALAASQYGSPEKDNQRLPRLAPGVQLSVTGLLAHLGGRRVKALSTPLEARPELKSAYLAWSLYDNDQHLIRSGSTAAVADANSSWRELISTMTIDLSGVDTRTGQLRVSLINEGSQPVYFDSLSILHPQDQLVVSQENHYYPFGLAISGVGINTIAATQPSKELYNGGSELQDELLGSEAGVYSTFYRTYDPAIGRFQGIDPLTDKYSDLSPYQFSYNDPVNFNDVTGAESDDGGGLLNWIKNLFSGGGGGHYELVNGLGNDGGQYIWIPDGSRDGGPSGPGGPGGGGGWSTEAIGAWLGPAPTYGGGGSGSGSGPGGPGGGATPKKPAESKLTPAGILKSGGVFALTLVADDATGIGIADDVLIPPVVIGTLLFAAGVLVYDAVTTHHLVTTIPKDSDRPGLRIALGVDDYLEDFAQKTESVSYQSNIWALATDNAHAVLVKAYTAGLLDPKVTFHFNLSTIHGLVNDPTNLKVYAKSATVQEFIMVMTYFRDRTTFYVKKGSKYIPVLVK